MKVAILFLFLVSGAPKLYPQPDLRLIIESTLTRGEKDISIPKGTYSLMENDLLSIMLKDLKDFIDKENTIK